jgi:hypothetical protein
MGSGWFCFNDRTKIPQKNGTSFWTGKDVPYKITVEDTLMKLLVHFKNCTQKCQFDFFE